jgi:hypothetical protein
MSWEDAVSSALVAQLKAAVPWLAVEVGPDDWEAYPFARADKVALVVYNGSNYEYAENGGWQCRRAEFDVLVLCRALGRPRGVWDGLAAARAALLGFVPLSAGAPLGRPLRLKRDAYVGRKDGVWRYALTFTVEGWAMPENIVPTELTEQGQRLTRATLDDAFGGGSEVTVP